MADSEAGKTVLETPRLLLREVAISDGSFILRLLNEPSWLENIGDRGVHCLAEADGYIRNLGSQYASRGYGLYAVQLKSTDQPIGLCGLIKRDFLAAPDLGFALLPSYVGAGYAFEAARNLMVSLEGNSEIDRLYAIVKRDNHRSIRLLDRLGFRHERPFLLPDGEEIELYMTVPGGPAGIARRSRRRV